MQTPVASEQPRTRPEPSILESISFSTALAEELDRLEAEHRAVIDQQRREDLERRGKLQRYD